MILAAVAMLAVTGCKGKGDETGTSTESTSATETQSEPAVVTKVTYTAQDGRFSIVLPDSTWKNTNNDVNNVAFASEGQGEITIGYFSGDYMDTLPIGSTEERLLKRLKKTGVDTDNVQVSNFQFDKSTGVKVCSYTLTYKDTTAGVFYTSAVIRATDSEGFQVMGNVKKGDTALLASVQEAVNSFQLLKDLSGSAGGESSEGTNSTEEQDGSGSTDSSGGASSGSQEERYFFDEEGNTIYTTENSDGKWVDKNGTVYYFYEDGVEDSNGTWYYYDPPSYRSGSSGGSSSSGSSSSSGDSADYYDFYDKNGNYVKATKDSNGNWVGDDGKTYTFGEKGVTDSDGNFHPY